MKAPAETESLTRGQLDRLVRRWLVTVFWEVAEGYCFVKADWTRPNGVVGGGEWYKMIPEYPPSQMIDNPGDKAPATIQGTVWAMCDEAWRQWQDAPNR